MRPDQVNLQDKWGKTALHRALENAQLEQMRLLIVEKHAREDIRDFWGNTPVKALEKRYSAETMKQNPANHFAVDGDSFRYEDVDDVIASKITNFQHMGRYMYQQRLFREKLGPELRQYENAETYPPNVIYQFFRFLFS